MVTQRWTINGENTHGVKKGLISDVVVSKSTTILKHSTMEAEDLPKGKATVHVPNHLLDEFNGLRPVNV